MAPPREDRSLYQIASSFFAVVVILFATAGIVVSAFGGAFDPAGFVICVVFLGLGVGRLYLGLRR